MTITAANASLNQDIEEMQAESHGHTYGCFEMIADEICEAATAKGIAYKTGAFDEVIDGMTVLDRIVERLTTGESDCQCNFLTKPLED